MNNTPKLKNDPLPETVHEAVRYFADGDNAFNFMVRLRWPRGVCCPTCESEDVRFLEKLSAASGSIPTPSE